MKLTYAKKKYGHWNPYKNSYYSGEAKNPEMKYPTEQCVPGNFEANEPAGVSAMQNNYINGCEYFLKHHAKGMGCDVNQNYAAPKGNAPPIPVRVICPCTCKINHNIFLVYFSHRHISKYWLNYCQIVKNLENIEILEEVVISSKIFLGNLSDPVDYKKPIFR